MEEDGLILDEPSERVKRTLLESMDTPDSKRSAQPIQLNQLDGLTLGGIVALLTHKELIRVMCMGNWLLKAKITAQLKSLHFTRRTLSIVHPQNTESIAFWQLPEMLTQPLPQLASLSIDCESKRSLTCRLDLLPPSLTRLAISNCIICVCATNHVMFNLPLLHDLALYAVSANQVGYGLQMLITDDQWLIPSIHHSPLLTRVVYHMTANATLNSLKTLSSLPSLESLSISRFIIEKHDWPRHLSSLQLFSSGEVASIPPTITHLKLPSVYEVETILGMAPASLLHLELPVNSCSTTWTDNLLQLLGRFTNLQTFNLSCGGATELIDRFFDLIDMSRLPRTINLISSLFALNPSHWHHLPPNVKFIADEIPSQRFEDLPRYNVITDAEYLPYFPKNLNQLVVVNGLLPMAMPYLTSVHFSIWNDTPTSTIGLLDNLPPVLTKLAISTQSTLVSFEGIDMATRFPRLATLWINIASEADRDVLLPWMNTLPRSLTHLSVTVDHLTGEDMAYCDETANVDLRGIVFPPNLCGLKLSIRNGWIDLPKTLPETIFAVHIQGKLIQCQNHITDWPLGLRHVRIRHTSRSVGDNTQTNIDDSVKILARRICDKVGRHVLVHLTFPSTFE